MANDTKEHWDGARIVWTVSYVHDGPKTKENSAEALQPHEEHRKKLVAKLEIQKDDIQSVLPISKVRLVHDSTPLDSMMLISLLHFSHPQNWELMNTAVLTGRQVSQVMKVFIVTQAGKVADVTLQSSCHAEDESVIKVSVCSSIHFHPLASFVAVMDDEFLIFSFSIHSRAMCLSECVRLDRFASVWCVDCLAAHSSSLSN